MGNKISRKRAAVEERYTRPQGLYQHRDVDYRKLRRLILDSKLAPCYPGADDSPEDLEECLICFLCYPSLNSSKCCLKGICTECFLQVKAPHATRVTLCPFCKAPNYAVEYRGSRTSQEKDLEQIEEQKVIEAKIKIQQQELEAEMQRAENLEDEGNLRASTTRPFNNLSHSMLNGLPLVDLHESVTTNFLNCRAHTVSSNQQTQQEVGEFAATDEQGGAIENVNRYSHPNSVLVSNVVPSLKGSSSCGDIDESSSSKVEGSVEGGELSVPAYKHSRREEDSLLNLEDIMMMEAIWQSIQEQGQNIIFKQDSHVTASASTPFLDCHKALQREESVYGRLKLSGIKGLCKSNLGTGSLAVAIAKLAECRVLSGANSLGYQAQEMISSHPLQFDHPHNGHQDSRQASNTSDNSRQESAQAPRIDMAQVQCQRSMYIQDGDSLDASLTSGGTMQVHNESPRVTWADRSSLTGKIVQNEDSSHNYNSRPQEVVIPKAEFAEFNAEFSNLMVSKTDAGFTVSEAFLNDHPTELGTSSAQVGAAVAPVPETFEEQMILAMTLSLAEAYTKNSL